MHWYEVERSSDSGPWIAYLAECQAATMEWFNERKGHKYATERNLALCQKHRLALRQFCEGTADGDTAVGRISSAIDAAKKKLGIE